MQKKTNNLIDIDEVMNSRFGAVGSESRNEFRKEAYDYCVGQMIYEARKHENITQSQLAERIGSNKSYISRIEKGQIEPGAGTFLRIIEALGLRFEIVKSYNYSIKPSTSYLSDSCVNSYSSKR